MNSMTVSQARANFGRALDQVIEDRVELIISRKAGDVVLVSRDEYDSLIETLHLLSSPANAAALATAQRQVEEGQTVRRGLLRS
ncbi:type II toxin-antitoxin system Phd/YefM family antitoxin [Microbacterium sp.]|uniref:type II toxin-antitoxin system Phd/YefM family antitoxin n=1 Tax=Microbacterium sp. TaxID=51671 RepID=UPI003C776D80